MDDFDPRILGRIPVAYGRAVIGRSVIDENELEVPESLIQDRIHAFFDIILHFIARHDDADFRFHRCGTPLHSYVRRLFRICIMGRDVFKFNIFSARKKVNGLSENTAKMALT
ncbi:hypothetical protein D3C71_1861550 [compost metagenome]